MKVLEFGSLFSGVGGLDLGLEQAGLKCKFQVENDKHCLTILNRHWPDVPKNKIRPISGLVGGDPCPIRSQANKIKGSSSLDLSGYFLAMVYRCKPRWVLRENVPAPDVMEFGQGLEVLGYQHIVIKANSAQVTGQHRAREWVVGFDRRKIFDRFVGKTTLATDLAWDCIKNMQTKERRLGTSLSCLSTRRHRMDTRDVYVYEGPQRGIRVLSHTERESLQGFPAGWTDGIPNSARERATGNAVTVPVAKWLGERIVEAMGIGRFE